MAINKVLASWRGAALRKMIEIVENVDGSMDVLADSEFTGAGRAMPKYSFDAASNIAGLVGAESGLISLLPRTWQDIDVPLATGCTAKPIYRTFIDAVSGNDAWDGSVPVWTGTTVGPKRTAVVANWTGSKTSWFTDEILLFAAGQTHTLTATGASIGITTRKHLGAYWLPSATNAAKPIIKSLNNAGAANSLERACISASGTLSQISISDLTIDTSDVANRFGISFYQTAAGQSINDITFSNVSVIGGTITDTVGYGGIGITYYGQQATLAPYPDSQNILYVDRDSFTTLTSTQDMAETFLTSPCARWTPGLAPNNLTC